MTPQTYCKSVRNRWTSALLFVTLGCGLMTLASGGCAERRPMTDASKMSANDPLKGISLYTSGAQAFYRGDRVSAERDLAEAVRQNPNLRMAQALLGDVYRGKGDYEKAAVHYERAAELDPYTLANHYNLGVVLQLVNRLKEAAVAYLRALDLDPRDMKSNMNLGTVYLALGQTEDAVNYLERATMIDVNSANAWSNLGVAYDARGKTAQAEKAYRKALELESSPVIMQNLGSNLVTQGRASEAVAVLKEVIARSNTASAHKRYADALVLSKQFDEALKEYDTALKLDPDFYPAMNDKAFVLVKQYKAGLELDEAKIKQAVTLWKMSLRLKPGQQQIEQALKESENSKLFGT